MFSIRTHATVSNERSRVKV